jgi:hypothetical protein
VKSGRKKLTAAEKQARERFVEAVLATAYLYETGCWFSHVVRHKCDGPIDPCHVIDKQGLKIAGRFLEQPEAMVFDPRNGVPGCRYIHSRFDSSMIRVYQGDLPDSIFMFVDQWEDAIGTPGILQEKLDRKCPKGTRP